VILRMESPDHALASATMAPEKSTRSRLTPIRVAAVTGDPSLSSIQPIMDSRHHVPGMRLGLQDADHAGRSRLRKRPARIALVTDQVVQVFGVDFRFAQAEFDGVLGTPNSCLDARKASSSGPRQPAGRRAGIAGQAALVVIPQLPKNVHRLLPAGPTVEWDFGGMPIPLCGGDA